MTSLQSRGTYLTSSCHPDCAMEACNLVFDWLLLLIFIIDCGCWLALSIPNTGHWVRINHFQWLTHCGLVMPFGNIVFSRHRHQAITLIIVDILSKVLCGIHMRTISQEALVNSISNICLDIALFKLLSHQRDQCVNWSLISLLILFLLILIQ